ncbi:uncharacterized protein LOC131149499 [Malania oleifera]|uniref:uncharacterized protein LOC131149499 n=1 Tax=Malania oleifera TaxID=397392 RepID=UPI0025AE557C|nr:uncharacterized protein LOC131149499 [Malania oleifera]
MQLKEELTLIQRESHLASKYLHVVKVLVDELVVIDSLISASDITLYALDHLGPKFREIAVPIRACDTSLMFKELYDMLVGHESNLRHVDASSFILVATANTTHHCPTASTFNCNQHSSPGSYGQHRPNFGRFIRKEQSGKSWIIFRPCDKVGHSAKTCHSV